MYKTQYAKNVNATHIFKEKLKKGSALPRTLAHENCKWRFKLVCDISSRHLLLIILKDNINEKKNRKVLCNN